MPAHAPSTAVSPVAPSGHAQDIQQWEYQTIVLKAKKMNDTAFNRPLNDLGREGWELVSTAPGNLGVGYICFFFKRPLPR